MRIRATLSICFTVLTLSGFAFAEVTECEDDTECGENGVCKKGMWVDGCDAAKDGNTDHCNSKPMTAETGYCEVLPPTCETDAECGEYLTCEPSSDGVCWGDSNGVTGCSEPDPDAPSYCTQTTITCEDNSECPREFECVTAGKLCLPIACPEDEPDCGCSESDRKECRPRTIECENDSTCPEDWMCLGNFVDCGASPEGSDTSAPECDTSLKGQCYPTEWNSVVGTTGGDLGFEESDSSGKTEDGGTGAPRTDGESSSSGGGCSVSRVPSSGGWLLGLLGLPLLVSRRRRATQHI